MDLELFLLWMVGIEVFLVGVVVIFFYLSILHKLKLILIHLEEIVTPCKEEVD
ncbi:hypothetical protein KJ603_01800 [Patescibacteria group bacterium]|nr:hypothetical protein [Patescibacteria group bacterium]